MVETENTEQGGGGSKKKKRTILIVAGLLAAEAILFVGAAMLFGPQPESATANLLDEMDPEEAAREQEVPVLVMHEKLGNRKRGVLFVFDTKITAMVKAKHQDHVRAEIERLKADVEAGVESLWLASDPRLFEEPGWPSLTRQVSSLLDEQLGEDPEGEPYLRRCVVRVGGGFRADS